MSNVAMAGVTRLVETYHDDIPSTDAPLVTNKNIVIPPFGCKWVRGLVESLPVCSCQIYVIAKLVANQVTWRVIATSTYGDLCPGSRWVGMVLRNFSAMEVWIPAKTVTGNVQMAEVVPDLKVFKQSSMVPPQKDQPEVSWLSYSNPPEKELAWPSTISPQLGLSVPETHHPWKGQPSGVCQMAPHGSTRG